MTKYPWVISACKPEAWTRSYRPRISAELTLKQAARVAPRRGLVMKYPQLFPHCGPREETAAFLGPASGPSNTQITEDTPLC